MQKNVLTEFVIFKVSKFSINCWVVVSFHVFYKKTQVTIMNKYKHLSI